LLLFALSISKLPEICPKRIKYNIKVGVKVTLELTMEAQRTSKGIAPLFL
jgi:hypothetical protein